MPISFLAGLGNLIKDFELLKTCLDSDRRYLFSLKPKSKDSDIGELLLASSSDLSQIEALSFSDLSGNVNILSFSNLKVNPGIASDIFSLQYPEEVYINDQREK